MLLDLIQSKLSFVSMSLEMFSGVMGGIFSFYWMLLFLILSCLLITGRKI